MNRRKKDALVMTLLFFSAAVAFDLVFMGLPTGKPPTGQVFATVQVSGFEFGNCSTTLQGNFSLFSGYCLGTENNVSTTFGTIPNFNYAFTYDSSDPDNPWRSYNPGLPSWAVQDLLTISRNQGYWIKMAAPGNFSYGGIIKYENYIRLKRGWNLIGYPAIVVRGTGVTFSTIAGQYSEVAGYNETLQEYQTYQPGLTNNTLNWTYPFHGYWVYALQETTVVIYSA